LSFIKPNTPQGTSLIPEREQGTEKKTQAYYPKGISRKRRGKESLCGAVSRSYRKAGHLFGRRITICKGAHQISEGESRERNTERWWGGRSRAKGLHIRPQTPSPEKEGKTGERGKEKGGWD